MKRIFNYFLRGLIFLFPVVATLYILVALADWANRSINPYIKDWLQIDIPGLGILLVFLIITLIGLLASTAFINPVLRSFEKMFGRMPFVKIIYSSIKELTEAFVGEKKKFTEPVLVDMMNNGIKKMGFVTQKDLSQLKLDNMVAVYCPHSYNFSGNLFIVPGDCVTPVNANSAQFMRYIISGGVTELHTHPADSEEEKS